MADRDFFERRKVARPLKSVRCGICCMSRRSNSNLGVSFLHGAEAAKCSLRPAEFGAGTQSTKVIFVCDQSKVRASISVATRVYHLMALRTELFIADAFIVGDLRVCGEETPDLSANIRWEEEKS